MAEEKARLKLDKAKAFLEEAKALVTVYVVMTNATYVHISEREKLSLHGYVLDVFTAIGGGGSVHWFLALFFR